VIKPANIEIIKTPEESLQRAWMITRAARSEILQIYSTPNSVRRQIKMVGLQVFKDAILTKRPNPPSVRILIPDGEGVDQIVRLVNEQLPEMSIRVMDAALRTNITIHIVDRNQCMIFELKDDTRQDSYDAVGVTLYSDSKTIVSSYVAIFESLWKQTELYEQIKEANVKFLALNSELTAAYEQLKIQERMEREFINIAAHELKTPMMPIMAVAEILESKLHDGTEVALNPGDARIVIRNAKRLEQLSQVILDVTKIESNALRLNRQVVPVREIIAPIVQDFESQLVERRVRLALDVPDDIFVEGDKERLHQVVANLLSNAIKFTEDGEVTITAGNKELPAKAGEYVFVEVHDTGTGIDQEVFPKLFTRFTTKSETGMGLGLYISKKIVEAHGGRIWGRNNSDGKGATITFTLPSLSGTDTGNRQSRESEQV
jgi:signal transduction histidine kinase